MRLRKPLEKPSVRRSFTPSTTPRLNLASAFDSESSETFSVPEGMWELVKQMQAELQRMGQGTKFLPADRDKDNMAAWEDLFENFSVHVNASQTLWSWFAAFWV